MSKENQVVQNLITQTVNGNIVWERNIGSNKYYIYKTANDITGDSIAFHCKRDGLDSLYINGTYLKGISYKEYDGLNEAIVNQSENLKAEIYDDILEIGINWK